MKKLIATAVLAFGFLSAASVSAGEFGSSKSWSSDWAQGVDEYVVGTKDGSAYVNISCDGSEPTELYASVVTKGTKVIPQGQLSVIIDGVEYVNPFSVNSYSSKAQYHAFWDKFRGAKTLSFKVGGVTKEVTTNGISKTLPAYSNSFECGLGF